MSAKIRYILLALALLSLPTQVVAATAADLHAIYNDTEYLDNSADGCTDTGTPLGGPAGSGPLYGPQFPAVANTADLATKITAYMQSAQPGNPMMPYVDQLVSEGQQYNVNPALAVAQAQKETQFGTTGTGRPPQDNVYGINPPGGFANYANISDSIKAYYADLAGGAYLGAPANETTIAAVITTYAPPQDGNDTAGYIQFVNDTMQKILSGIATTPGTNPAPDSTVTNPCSGTSTGVTSAGALGWNLTPPNAMITYLQDDPRWAKTAYGSDDVATSGCGPTSIAMVVATLTNNPSITPGTTATKYSNYDSGAGTEWSVFPQVGKDYNLNVTNLGTNLAAAAQIIQQGGLVIMAVDAGYFTSDGHIMVIRAVTPDGGSFYLADPNADGNAAKNTQTTPYTSQFLLTTGNMQNLWGYTKQ